MYMQCIHCIYMYVVVLTHCTRVTLYMHVDMHTLIHISMYTQCTCTITE